MNFQNTCSCKCGCGASIPADQKICSMCISGMHSGDNK